MLISAAAADMQAARKSESLETTIGSHKIHAVLQLQFAGVSGAWNSIVAMGVCERERDLL